jgi:hypothetical protein
VDAALGDAELRVARWKVPRDEVDEAIANAMERYDVAELACDPPGWHAELDGWQVAYGDVVVEYPTNQRARMAPACDRFCTGVHEGGPTHSGDPVLSRHVGHCVARETPHGVIVQLPAEDRRGRGGHHRLRPRDVAQRDHREARAARRLALELAGEPACPLRGMRPPVARS